jgi:amino acid transporter
MATDTGAPGAAVTTPTDVGLKREVGLIGAIWASESSIIGSGWLFAAFGAAQLAGPSAIFAWMIAGVALTILALVHSELGAMYPVSGGTARFPHYAFGSIAGISFGFFSWLQAAAVAPIECFAVMRYGSYYWHSIYNATTGNVTGTGFAMTIILMALFTGLNFFGIRWFARINSTIMWWKLAIPVLAIIIFFFKFHGGNFTAGGPGPTVAGAHVNGTGGFMPFGIKGIFSAVVGGSIVFAALGFEQADQLAGEIKNPQKNLPRAIMGAMLIGITVYILLQVVFIGATPTGLLHNGFAGIAATNPIAIGPFAGLAGAVALGWLAVILRLDAFISPFGTGMIYTTSTSRVGYGLARNRYFPQIFSKTDSRGVPWVSLIFTFALGLLFLLPFPSWHALIGLITSASVLMYAGAPLSLSAFRQQVPEASRPYRLSAAAVISPLAFAVAGLIIYWSGFETIWKLGICLVIGYVVIGVAMVFDQHRPPLDWKSATWLPVYLLGMGIISWQGQYGPGNTGRIGLFWDMLIVAVFSLVIFYWAQAVKLPRDEMLKLVEAQHGVEPPERD